MTAGGDSVQVTAETVTDEQIECLKALALVDDAPIADLCRVALQRAVPTTRHPFCRVCGWRKGGLDSWDGVACKCKLRAGPFHRCGTCNGVGTVPYNIGAQHCPSCDGSGLVDTIEIARARACVADAINARAKGGAR